MIKLMTNYLNVQMQMPLTNRLILYFDTYLYNFIWAKEIWKFKNNLKATRVDIWNPYDK